MWKILTQSQPLQDAKGHSVFASRFLAKSFSMRLDGFKLAGKGLGYFLIV